MRKARVPITNFQYGEISPSLSSRTDSAIYNSSAQSVKNFFLMSEGGVKKRGGFKFIHDFTGVTEDTSKTQQVRIIPFIFSDDEQYIIALSNQKVEIFFVNPTTGAVTLATTLTADTNSDALVWTAEYLHEITYAQGGDILFLSHATFETQQLIRTGLNSFQVEPFVFQTQAGAARIYQPYYHFQATGVTLNPSATTGTGITVTTSLPYFDLTGGASELTGDFPNSKHVGVRLRYHESEILITSVQSNLQATGNVIDELYVELDANAIRTVDGSTTIEIQHINHGMSASDSVTVRNATAVGGINAAQINGARTIQAVINEDRYTLTAGSAANVSEDGGGNIEIITHAPTEQWFEQSYSKLRGYPAAVGFHENRLWFGGTPSQPDTIWASKSGLYYNFDIGEALDDESIELILSIGEVATIRHFVSNRDIHIFTAGSEFFIPSFQNEPITPTNARVKRQTSFGSTFTRPQPFYGSTLFTQLGGSAVRSFVFSDSEAAYKSDPISLLSAHLINNPIQSSVTIGDIGSSDAAVFFVNADGSLVVYNLNKVENIAGWTNFETSGKFHSIASVSDKLFSVLNVDLGSGSNSFVLCELDKTANLDCSKTYTGISNGVFSVSSQFENGAVLDVINGTDYLGSFTVSGGNLNVSAVDTSLTSCEVGFGFNVELKTNPLDLNTNIGPETGRPRTLSSIILDMNDTLSVSVNSKKLIIRNVNSDFSQARQPVTGKKEFRLLGYSRDPQVTITQTAPLKVQVNGMVAEVTF
tara:strand:- start:8309 stop:10588 length:2280 start_codon:yes stop_codon:yes gene_type:complete